MMELGVTGDGHFPVLGFFALTLGNLRSQSVKLSPVPQSPNSLLDRPGHNNTLSVTCFCALFACEYNCIDVKVLAWIFFLSSLPQST